MTRRKQETRPAPAPAPSPHRRATAGLLAQTAILGAVLGVVTLIAELAGAANLGVALSIGAIAFTLMLMFFILKR